jgi:hypothetical protein
VPVQVSHHPPVSVAHAENSNWTYDIVSAPTTKFLGNSLEVYPKGEQQRVRQGRMQKLLDMAASQQGCMDKAVTVAVASAGRGCMRRGPTAAAACARKLTVLGGYSSEAAWHA